MSDESRRPSSTLDSKRWGSREALLKIQSALLSCLTDPRAIGDFKAGGPGWEVLAGIDPGRIEMLESMAQEKRVGKVRRIFPRSFPFFQAKMARLTEEFAANYVQSSASSYTNACQFYAMLRRLWRSERPDPPFLPDLVYCELAMVSVGRRTDLAAASVLGRAAESLPGPLMVRRRPGIRWRRCEYDIRALIDPDGREVSSIVRRRAYVVLSRALNSTGVRAFEIEEGLFQIITGLYAWTRVEPTDGASVDRHTVGLLGRLEGLGILEARLCESA